MISKGSRNRIAVVSKCLLGFRCRYDNEVRDYGIRDFLEKKAFIVISVCPEMEIGLGVPREPIRMVLKNGSILLIQKKTQYRLKRRLEKFANMFLNNISHIDVFILKSRSPSCGNEDCKVYLNMREDKVVFYSDGVFTKICKKLFPDVPIYNEKNFYRLK